MQKLKTGLKIIIFIAVAAVIFAGVNFLVRPVWTDEYHLYDTVNGFYEEPEDTIETIFLGTSDVIVGITPMELYENYGICSYNLGTVGQPMMASYYWLEEAYRLHSETLDTVVLDVSRLKFGTSQNDPRYIQAFEYMRFSKVKYHFIRDFSDNFIEDILYMMPALSFHDRWNELSGADFSEYKHDVAAYDRGYDLRIDTALDTYDSYSDFSIPFYALESDAETNTNSEDLSYFERIIDFCEEHSLKLVLIKTPQSGTNPWSDAAHNTAQSLADQYQLDFIDFNYLPYINDIEFNFATDSYDEVHMNYYGASKLTDWLGSYLVETCGNRDVRGDEKYAFMEDELEDYNRKIIQTELCDITDPADYLSDILQKKDYAVFIAVKDDACDSLTEAQRESFEEMGLTELSQLTTHASYLAVIDDGIVITEQMQEQDQEYIDSVNTDEGGEEALCISYSGKLSHGLTYSVESGGYIMGNKSSIQIDGTEYSPNKRGLNIVVYDKKSKQVVDQASFDTYASPERDKPDNEAALEEAIADEGSGALSGKLLELYRYDRLCDNTETAKVLKQSTDEEDNLTAYLAEFWDKEFSIYLSANGDIADALTESERKTLADMGLTDLSEIEDGDSYLAVIREGDIVTEQCAPDEKELEASGEIYKICSGSTDEESVCSLMVQGTEYVGKAEGLNIVIYDNVLDQVIDSVVYDTNHTFVSD